MKRLAPFHSFSFFLKKRSEIMFQKIQVEILNAMKMIMLIVDTMLMMIFLRMIMLMMMFSISQLQQMKVIDILQFSLLTMFCLILIVVIRKILLVRMMKQWIHCKETLCLGPGLDIFISIQIILVIQGLGKNFSLNQFP